LHGKIRLLVIVTSGIETVSQRPRLKCSESLHEKAQKWAEHLASSGGLQHSGMTDLGENVAYKFSSDKRNITGTYSMQLII